MRLLIVVLLLCNASMASAQGEKVQHQREGDQAKPHQKERGSKSEPLFVTINPTVKSRDEAAHEQSEANQKADHDRRALKAFEEQAAAAREQVALADYQLWATWIAALASAIAVLFTGWAARAASRSADAAKESAEGTMSSVRAIEGTSALELRAYLGLREHVIQKLNTNSYQIQLHLRNTGHTPARKVRAGFDWSIGGSDGPPEGFPAPALHGSYPLGPGMERPLRRVMRNFTEAQADMAGNTPPTGDIFVWGRIEYEDIYDTPQHLSFRFVTRETTTEVVKNEEGRFAIVRTGWALQATEEGNEAS
ncbi:MAG: hypothetical protein AB7O31_00935 [Burkholderiales bacterium]